jgi:hypothetical protein
LGCSPAVGNGSRRFYGTELRQSPNRCRDFFPVVDERVIIHEPSGAAFELIWQLAVVHEGWTAAADATETEL